jgi:hypothetical protein
MCTGGPLALSHRLQFNSVAHSAFHPMQFGGIAQRSTKDAGVYLTHLVWARWVEDLQTSMVRAFSVFDPLHMEQILMALGHIVWSS